MKIINWVIFVERENWASGRLFLPCLDVRGWGGPPAYEHDLVTWKRLRSPWMTCAHTACIRIGRCVVVCMKVDILRTNPASGRRLMSILLFVCVLKAFAKTVAQLTIRRIGCNKVFSFNAIAGNPDDAVKADKVKRRRGSRSVE